MGFTGQQATIQATELGLEDSKPTTHKLLQGGGSIHSKPYKVGPG